MNQKRLIGRLDIKNSNLIKSINLEGLRTRVSKEIGGREKEE